MSGRTVGSPTQHCSITPRHPPPTRFLSKAGRRPAAVSFLISSSNSEPQGSCKCRLSHMTIAKLYTCSHVRCHKHVKYVNFEGAWRGRFSAEGCVHLWSTPTCRSQLDRWEGILSDHTASKVYLSKSRDNPCYLQSWESNHDPTKPMSADRQCYVPVCSCY